MKHVCANCGSSEIEPGEAGARSRCALCGHTKFNAAVVIGQLSVVSCRPQKSASNHGPRTTDHGHSRTWFEAMHAAVEEAK